MDNIVKMVKEWEDKMENVSNKKLELAIEVVLIAVTKSVRKNKKSLVQYIRVYMSTIVKIVDIVGPVVQLIKTALQPFIIEVEDLSQKMAKDFEEVEDSLNLLFK